MREEQRARRADHQRRQGGPAAVLRREAIRERPAFSPDLHRRLLERLESGPGRHLPASSSQPRAGGVRGRSHRVRWIVTASLGGIALLASLGLVGRFWDRRGPAEPPVAGRLAAAWADLEATRPGAVETLATDEVGIDRLPMFDEIGDGVVEGVATLAVSLLDVPDFAMLADLGADFQDGDPAGR
jgi:hypothetical protein